jgi:hypothetical protein
VTDDGVLATIDRVADEPDPVLRNLLITQTYHELSNRLRSQLSTDATWCTFATWASKTAGHSIRREALSQAIVDLVDGGATRASLPDDLGTQGVLPDTERGLREFGRAVRARDPLVIYHASIDRAADVLAEGNRLVFAEVARPFGALAVAAERGERGQAAAERVLPEVRPAGGPGVDVKLVRQGFEAYIAALSEQDERRRAQLVLLGNSRIVLHEQQRLHRAIADAVQAPTRLRPEHEDAAERALADGEVDGPTFLHGTDRWHNALDGWWGRVLTEHLMRLEVPDRELRLDEDIPGCPPFPEELSRIDDDHLLEFMSRWDRTGLRGSPCGARDWRVLDDRMTYIVNLFRGRQRSGALFSPPFDQGQVEALRAGSVPAGPL